MRTLMCRPDYYGIEYAINPWMNITKKADHALAVKQWESLYQTILDCGANIDLISPVAGWPDLVFTANGGLLYKNNILLSHFKYKERQGEEAYFKAWFEKAGFTITNDIKNETLYFEGEGDALFAGDLLFAGFGFRSDRRIYETTYFDQENLVFCELANPYFYHLDTCFCPLNASLAMWYPAAFTKASQTQMADKIDLIAVSEEEARQFACNAVVLDNHLILTAHCPQITKELQKRGFVTHAQEMSEYIKAGGACKCLVLRID